METLLDEDRNWQNENYQQFFDCWQQQGINSTLLITTQDKPKSFQGLQQWYSLGGMKIEEGISLLNKLAIQGTLEEHKTFIKYVDGHPLTIKLVAGYLREYYDSQLSQVTELGLEEFDLAYKEAEGLHRHKQDARLSWIIQQHLNRLNSKQREFLINLSVYRLPFNHEAASYMWCNQEVKPFVIQKQLRELCNRSLLIKAKDNKYQFESLLQKYVLQQKNNLTNAHENAIEYYKANSKDKKSWQVLEDVTEYLEIHDHYCKLNLYNLADLVLDYCLEFLSLRGYYATLIKIYNNLISNWKTNLKNKDKPFYVQAINKYANSLFYIGEYQTAIHNYQRVLEICHDIEDTIGVAHALNNLGNAYTYLCQYQTAIEHLNQSLNISQNTDNVFEEQTEEYKYIASRSLNNLGNIYNECEQYRIAIKYVKQSLRITKKTEDSITRSHSYNILGNSSKGLEKYEIAIRFYMKHWKLVRENQDLNEEARCLNNLGDVYASLGNYQLAINLYQKSIKIKEKIGDKYGKAMSLYNLGNIYNLSIKYLEAISYYEKSICISQQIGNQKCEANAWFNIGDSQEKLQQILEAEIAYRKARQLYQMLGLEQYIKYCDHAIQELENIE